MKAADLLKAAAELPPARARLVLGALAAKDAEPDTLATFKKDAAAAFRRDMQPVSSALAAALHKGGIEDLRAFRALLPSLLKQVIAKPVLADLLAHQLGKTFLDGMATPPEPAE